MPTPRLLLLSLLALPTITTAAEEKTILSCADVLCPIGPPGTNSAECTLLSTTYTGIGAAAVPSRPDLSWTQAIAASDTFDLDNPDTRTRTFIKDFFLGSSSDGAAVSGGGACALFFTEVTEAANWEPVPNHTVSQGTCAEAMSEACVAAMVERARGVDVAGLGVGEACEKVRREFESGGGGGACAEFGGEGGWKGVVARVISGEGAPEAISAAQNASSNCWPVQPKSRDLTLVAKFNSTGGFTATELFDELFMTMPILTVFLPTGNTSGEGEVRSEAQLTCLKPVDETTATEASKSDGRQNLAGALEPRSAMGFLVALGVVGVLGIFC
ncbi:hypothetical protein QBC39DRAFT_379922 [Podospora conica]|nr:hypothetical protein QBC39DRAFT_379922 [Schizothecium conicum]